MPTTSSSASSRGWRAGFDFRFAAPLLRGNKEAKRLAVASDCERLPAFEVAR
jgi:hypothetical protein